MLTQHVPIFKFILLMPFLLPITSFAASDFWYWFRGNDIDYFNEGKKVKDPLRREVRPAPAPNVAKGVLGIREYDKQPFDWKDYDDPSSPVFFDEGGDFVPARPYRILAANPTAENIERVKKWEQRKIETTMMISSLLTESPQKQTERKLANFSWNKVGILYFYRTSCSACREQASIIKQLEQLGAQVSPVQLDFDSEKPLHARSLNYDDNFKRNFEITVTPTFYVYANHKNATWQGYTPIDAFQAKVSQLFSSPRL